MCSKLADIGGLLDVTKKDMVEIRKVNRRRPLAKIAEISLPAVSAILGLVAAEATYPVRTRFVDDAYPFASMVIGSAALPRSRERSWITPIVVSVVSFIVAFTLVAWINSAMSETYGLGTKYGVFSRRG